ncbi:MAG: hypothetical protein HWE39_11980 [Oceanospirillaceae bacterium]|nr:hypothetical protein [Oceanospirillaceae bacterium]
MMNKKLLAAMVAASAALTGCGSDSDSSSSSKTFLETAVEANPRTVITAAVDNCTEFGGNLDETVCVLPSRITATGGSFSKDVTYYLEKVTFLGYGDKELETASDVSFLKDNPIELTIPAGTTIEGAPRSAFVVTRGAVLNAEGTEAEPVVFESADADLTGSSEWGGLVLQGFGVSNQCPDTGICNVEGEGGVGFYAGDDNTDSSGSLEYVIVTEGGYEISTGNELNGVGFMAVGSGTNVDYLQVNENSDDAVEFWGGAVVAKHLVLTANDDDSIDWDHGWVGGIQYAIVKQVNGDGDHVFETDNDGDSMDNEPRSMPTIANVTAITGGLKAAIKHREGTGAKFYNVAVVEQGTAAKCLDIDDQATADQIDTGLIYTNVALGCTTALEGDDEVSGEDFGKTLLDSQVSNVEVDATVAVDADYVVTNANAITTAPTIANTAITGNTVMGAVENAADDWFAGWTLAGSL